MKRHLSRSRPSGFTLLEMLVVGAIVVVVIMLAAPSLRSFIEVQRVRGVTNQMVTDVQFARTEAASRSEVVAISFDNNPSMTCYTVHTCGGTVNSSCRCDCRAAELARCTAPQKEIRTVQYDASSGVRLVPVNSNGSTAHQARVMFDPLTGSLSYFYTPLLILQIPPPAGELWAVASPRTGSNPARLRTTVNTAGRPSICSPGSTVSGAAACPP